MMMSKLL
ncbi:hypothetical protein Zm00014a_030843 [Zea mays]|nr:hypothetical protein Zm00014a_030843 [Zea mays]